MEYIVRFAEKQIDFTLFGADRLLTDKLTFIHLLEMKFDGASKGLVSNRENGKEILSVTVEFPDWSACSNAQAHCSQFLTGDGSVLQSYAGALERADPGRRLTLTTLMQARANSAERAGK